MCVSDYKKPQFSSHNCCLTATDCWNSKLDSFLLDDCRNQIWVYEFWWVSFIFQYINLIPFCYIVSLRQLVPFKFKTMYYALQQISLIYIVYAVKEVEEPELVKGTTILDQPPSLRLRPWQWWILVTLNITFLLIGQCGAVILGRFYYDQGGTSKWMATLVQTAAFPIFYIPFFFFPSPKIFLLPQPLQPSLTGLLFLCSPWFTSSLVLS